MIADVISQLERREGMLPLSVEDRPRLGALLAARPDALAALRDALALAAQHFPQGDEIRLVVVADPDLPNEGDVVAVQIWTAAPPAMVRAHRDALVRAWVALHPDSGSLPIVIGPRYRTAG